MTQRRPRTYYQDIENTDNPKADWRKQAMLQKEDPETEHSDTKRLNRAPGSRPRAQVLAETEPSSKQDIDLMFGAADRPATEDLRKKQRPSSEKRTESNSGNRTGSASGNQSVPENRKRPETETGRRPEGAGRKRPETNAGIPSEAGRKRAEAAAGKRPESSSGKRTERGTAPQNRRPREESSRANSQKPQWQPSNRSRRRRPSEKSEKKVFSRSFKKGFLIAWGIFVVLLIAAMVILWSFLKRYENGLPEHYLNQIIREIGNGDIDGLHLVTSDDISIDDPSILVSKDAIGKFLSSKNAEDPLRYVKLNAESSENENVYVIRSGEETLLKVFLDRNTENGKTENGWHESKTQMSADELQLSTLNVQIPTTSSLEINGTLVDRSMITEAEGQIQLLSNLVSSGLIGPQPTVDTYTVKGIFADPEIIMISAEGNRVPCTETNGLYLAGFEADDAFVAEQTARVMGMFEPYAKYFSGDAGREALDAVMLNGSPAYWNASAADVSWMQEHDGIRLSEENVKNIRKYSDDCYSCDISFKEEILQGGEAVRIWDTNMTWIMVNAGDYYLADLVTKTADE